jgi:hypothetical protein
MFVELIKMDGGIQKSLYQKQVMIINDGDETSRVIRLNVDHYNWIDIQLTGPGRKVIQTAKQELTDGTKPDPRSITSQRKSLGGPGE